jgi:hypothetical protein
LLSLRLSFASRSITKGESFCYFGLLGEERTYGPVTVAVGDRVICRSNERDLDVDNGTRGTVRHLHETGVVIEPDAHLARDLPAGYVATTWSTHTPSQGTGCRARPSNTRPSSLLRTT